MKSEKVADEVLSRMTLDEKVGQCIVHAWRGSLVTPSIVQTIEKLHCAGLRVEPFNTESAGSGYHGRPSDTRGFKKPKGYFKVAETHFRPMYPGFSITATEYARRLNRLKEIAMNRPSGVPLHITTDFEGDFSHDFPFDGINMFPANMGIRAAGGPRPLDLKGAANRMENLVRKQGFPKIVEGPLFHDLDHRIHRRVGGHHHDLA